MPDGRVRYARRGTGDEKVVLIHGFGGDLDNWLFNIDALAENATVYALDLPGHGQSVKSMADPSLKVLAMTVVSFMNAMEIKSAHLVGHSLGGAIAMEIAREAKDRVKSLTLIASAGLGPEINVDYIDGFIAASSRRDLKPVIEQLFANPSLVTRQLVDDLLKYKRLDGVDQALRGIAASVSPRQAGRQARSRTTSRRWSSGAGTTRSFLLRTPHRPRAPGSKSSRAPATWCRWSRRARSTR